MATDRFKNNSEQLDSPANDAFSITPHDSNELSQVTRALFVGGAGNINLTTAAGTTLVFTGVTAGSILPIQASKVLSTSTTATNIVGLV